MRSLETVGGDPKCPTGIKPVPLAIVPWMLNVVAIGSRFKSWILTCFVVVFPPLKQG